MKQSSKISNGVNLKKITNFFFEIQVLKRTPRSGLKNVGIRNSDSVAEHIFLTAQITYVLGKMEKVNAERAALIALFHDNGEARIGDGDLVKRTYLDTNGAEERVFFDQIKNLPGEGEIKTLYKEWVKKDTREATVARDADLLELALQVKCFLDSGNKLLSIWLKFIKAHLKTKSAKKLFKTMEKTNIDDWWREIPEIKEKLEKNKPYKA